MQKRFVFCLILPALVALLLAGCAGGFTYRMPDIPEDDGLQRYRRLEVYEMDAEQPLCTIEDAETLREFVERTSFAVDVEELLKMEALEEAAAEQEALFQIISYKESAARTSDELERIEIITVYKDSRIIAQQVSPGVIKNMPVGEEDLLFHYEVSEETSRFFASLYERGLPTAI